MSKNKKFIKQAKLPQAAYDQNRTVDDIRNMYPPTTTAKPQAVTKGIGEPSMPEHLLQDYCSRLDAAINKTPVKVLCDRNHWRSARFFVMWQDGKGIRVELEVKRDDARGLDIRANYYMFMPEWETIVKGMQNKDFKPIHKVINFLEEKILNYGKPSSTI